MRAARQPADERHEAAGQDRLSQLDEAFLYMERPNQPMQIGCVAEIDGRFERDELIAALRERLTEVARFRQRPAHSTLNLRGVRWEDDPQFDLAQHVRHVSLPAPGDQVALQHVVETLFATPLSPDRPLWEVHLIDGLSGGRSAILCKIHHCMSDGISALGVLERIADPRDGAACDGDATARSGRAAAGAASAPRSTATRVLPGAIGGFLERLLAATTDPANLLAAVRDVGSAVDALASFVQDPITELPFHGRLGHGRRMIWRSFPFDEIESLRVAGNCTVNDAILTVLAGALRTFLDEEGVCPDDARVRMLVPMSVRRPGADTTELGNVITAVFPWLPVDEEDPLERARRVRKEMGDIKGREKGRATAILLGALGLVPSAVEAAALRLLPDVPLVSAACTNVRGPAEPLRLLGRRIAQIHPIMNLFQGVGLTFAVASYAGRLSICAATDPRLLPNGERLMQTVEEALYELRTEYWRNSAAMKLARGISERTSRSSPRVPLPAPADTAASPVGSSAAAAAPREQKKTAAEAARRPRAAVDVDLLTDPDLSFEDARFLRDSARERGAAEASRDGAARPGARSTAPRRSARTTTLELGRTGVAEVTAKPADEEAEARGANVETRKPGGSPSGATARRTFG